MHHDAIEVVIELCVGKILKKALKNHSRGFLHGASDCYPEQSQAIW